MKSETEIQEMADKAADAARNPQFFGMSYEQGVQAALDWVLGNMADNETPLS